MEPANAATALNPVVIAPSYNNAATLADVLTRIAALGLPIILVDDGCTDATDDVVKYWTRAYPLAPIQVLKHKHNRGKAAALRTGFAAAMNAGYSHAVSIDTDGQHDPERIPKLLDVARHDPAAYVLGWRDSRHADYPARSRWGRRLSNLLIRLECGLRVYDSQCGLRVYPLELIRTVRCRSGRFGYEAEMITRAGWAGFPVVQAPVNTRYLPPGQRVSHFRPWRDSLHAIAIHLRLVFGTIAPIPHRQYHPAGIRVKRRFSMRDLLRWMNPMRAWRELRRGEIDRTELAAALAVGVFVANLPIYPLQTVFALYLARRLHLNPLAVLGGTQVSTPPISAVLIAAAICLGHLLLHGSLPTWPNFHDAHAIWRLVAWPLLIDWAVGGVLLGILMGAAVFATISWFYDDNTEAFAAGATEQTEFGGSNAGAALGAARAGLIEDQPRPVTR